MGEPGAGERGDCLAELVRGLPLLGEGLAEADDVARLGLGVPLAGLALMGDALAGLGLPGVPLAGLDLAGVALAGLDLAGVALAGLAVAGVALA